MDQVKYFVAVFFLLIVMSQPVSAAGSNCSYAKSVQQGGITFDITSRPASGCAIQIITVGVRRGGKTIAAVKADVDYLARSARAVDLTGDGRPDLAVFSRTTGGAVTEALDVYRLEGTTLRRLTVPEVEHKSSYRGGDRFHLEDRLIVRTVPVYREGDPAGKPSGGTRTDKFEFKDGAFLLYVQTERATDTSGDYTAQGAAFPTPRPVEAKPAVPASAALAITGIAAVESGIEIRINGPIEKYKTMKLENPERIAIDLPGATSSLIGKKLPVNKFGITTVRVGRNKGFLRVVLDTKLRTFPKYSVKPSGSGVLVEFTQ